MVRYSDKTVTYRSLTDMRLIMKKMESYLFPNERRPKNILVVSTKGIDDDPRGPFLGHDAYTDPGGAR
jgi:hypothetical protein